MPRQPIPPPPKAIPQGEVAKNVLRIALEWRRLERCILLEDADCKLASLRKAVDVLQILVDSPPTSPPPPRKR